MHRHVEDFSAPLDLMNKGLYIQATMAKQKTNTNYKVIAENRRARFDYAIESDLECGIVLMGSEVKSLRKGSSNIAESYAEVENGELWLVNSYIAPYEQAKTWGHEERRRRKLVRRSHFLTIIAAWVITVPAAATISMLIFWIISSYMGGAS